MPTMNVNVIDDKDEDFKAFSKVSAYMYDIGLLGMDPNAVITARARLEILLPVLCESGVPSPDPQYVENCKYALEDGRNLLETAFLPMYIIREVLVDLDVPIHVIRRRRGLDAVMLILRDGLQSALTHWILEEPSP